MDETQRKAMEMMGQMESGVSPDDAAPVEVPTVESLAAKVAEIEQRLVAIENSTRQGA